MQEDLTKPKILDSIKAERKLLEDQLEGLTEEQMLQPTLEGDGLSKISWLISSPGKDSWFNG